MSVHAQLTALLSLKDSRLNDSPLNATDLNQSYESDCYMEKQLEDMMLVVDDLLTKLQSKDV